MSKRIREQIQAKQDHLVQAAETGMAMTMQMNMEAGGMHAVFMVSGTAKALDKLIQAGLLESSKQMADESCDATDRQGAKEMHRALIGCAHDMSQTIKRMDSLSELWIDDLVEEIENGMHDDDDDGESWKKA